jgi:hypothetical protein
LRTVHGAGGTRAATQGGWEGYRGQPYRDGVYRDGPQRIPGRVQCAYYDLGGEGITYHDVDAMNHGSGHLNPADGTYWNPFRMDEGVDISYTKFHDQIDNSPMIESYRPTISCTSVGPSQMNASI